MKKENKSINSKIIYNTKNTRAEIICLLDSINYLDKTKKYHLHGLFEYHQLLPV